MKSFFLKLNRQGARQSLSGVFHHFCLEGLSGFLCDCNLILPQPERSVYGSSHSVQGVYRDGELEAKFYVQGKALSDQRSRRNVGHRPKNCATTGKGRAGCNHDEKGPEKTHTDYSVPESVAERAYTLLQNATYQRRPANTTTFGFCLSAKASCRMRGSSNSIYIKLLIFTGAASGDRTHDILSHSQAFCR